MLLHINAIANAAHCRFDTIYCDGKIRVAHDIRGDTLVVVNDGPPRIFT